MMNGTSAAAVMTSSGTPPLRLSDDDRWDVVCRRDAGMRGAFLLGVTTTGIYCRPGCPARQPLRRNVRFFDTVDQAEREGFRACRRCHPREVDRAADAPIARVCRFIEAHLDERLTLARLGRVAGISAFHLQRRFTKVMGIAPKAYADALRLGVFKRELRAGRPVLDAVVEAGYGSTSRIYERTADHLGMTPSRYRSGGAEQRIRYAIAETTLGLVLIASTDIGVCAIQLGPTRASLAASLRAEYPRAALEEDAAALAAASAVVRRLAAGRPATRSLPLDIAATAFQHQVWTALRRIPRGETRSYADIARTIGRPTAVRAVANACATNPVALVIPCHRVIRTDGRTGGYRWGSARKDALLASERPDPTPPRD